MIIEFIGSTGAGKTTLISEVRRRLAQTIDVTTSFELVAAPFGLSSVTHPTLRNVIEEILGLPFFVRALFLHRAFIVFILRMLARQANLSIFTLNNLRSLERKIGVYEIIRRNPHDQIVLVDEGTVLTAHNIFVYSEATYSREEIAGFANLVPLPDFIVYIKAPVDILVQRSLKRTDAPREMRSKDRAVIERYINSAVRMFDELIKTDNIQRRLLIVENSDQNDHEIDMVINEIVNVILDCQLSGRSI